jgi:sugar phosphate isomerase/epimerase
MKIAYAFRRGTFYPHDVKGFATAAPKGPARTRYLRKVNEIGFDGIELGVDMLGGMGVENGGVTELRKELDDAGTPCVAVRAGGALYQPKTAAQNRDRLERAVKAAKGLGAEVVNTAIAAPPRNPTLGESGTGGTFHDGSSQLASEDDFVRTARVLHEVGEVAGAEGLDITVEVHQHSIADNSWSTLHLLELADSPYVYANPDLGNILWNYDEPEESMEEAIVALAPHSKYWHCKNLHRVNIEEAERAYFIRVPLPDGDIDYRFAISAMQDASYDGYLAIEGANLGDQLHQDQRSLDYVKSILDEPR